MPVKAGILKNLLLIIIFGLVGEQPIEFCLSSLTSPALFNPELVRDLLNGIPQAFDFSSSFSFFAHGTVTVAIVPVGSPKLFRHSYVPVGTWSFPSDLNRPRLQGTPYRETGVIEFLTSETPNTPVASLCMLQ